MLVFPPRLPCLLRAEPQGICLPSLQAYPAVFELQARTYPDLLKSPHDEELMEYYCRSRLVYISVSLDHLLYLSTSSLPAIPVLPLEPPT